MNRSERAFSVRGISRLIVLGACFTVFLAWLIAPGVVDAGRHRAVEFLNIEGLTGERTLPGAFATTVAGTVHAEGEKATPGPLVPGRDRWSSTNL